MNISKQQTLLLHNVLFGYLTANPDLYSSVKDDVEDLMHMFEEFILNTEIDDNKVPDEPYDSEPIDIEEEDLEDEPSEDQVTPGVFSCLPKLRVEDHGERSSLEFYEDRNGDLCFCLTYQSGEESEVTGVSSVMRGSKSLAIEADPGELWEFSVAKFPVEWTRSLPVNKTLIVEA